VQERILPGQAQLMRRELEKRLAQEEQARIQAEQQLERERLQSASNLKQERRSLALKMLQENIPIATIARMTEFSPEQLQALPSQIQQN
jgi:hypothetical protein